MSFRMIFIRRKQEIYFVDMGTHEEVFR